MILSIFLTNRGKQSSKNAPIHIPRDPTKRRRLMEKSYDSSKKSYDSEKKGDGSSKKGYYFFKKHPTLVLVNL